MLLGSITLTADYQQIIPPDGKQHTGRFHWTLVVPADTTFAQDSDGTNAAELTDAQTIAILAENEALYAKGSGTLVVIGAVTG